MSGYTPTTWATSDTITAAKLNNLETQYSLASVSQSSATGNGSASTSSTSYVDLSTATNLTVTTKGGDVLLLATAALQPNGSYYPTVGVSVDGTDHDLMYVDINSNNAASTRSGFFIATGLAAGSHTFKLRLKASTGASVSVSASSAYLTAIELSR